MDTETESASEGTSTTWLLIYTAIALFVVHLIHTYSYFWRKGIPGPRPLPMLGNYMELFKLGFVGAYTDWTSKYGKTFGYYEGRSSTFVTADVDLARLILIKDFASFSSRDDGKVKLRYISDGLQSQNGAQWKKARSYMSPVFSGSKMKQMIPGVNSCCDILMEVIDKKLKNGETFEAKKIMSPFIMDCIARCVFGFEANCQRDPDNDVFVKHGTMCMTGLSKRPGYLVAALVPQLTPLMDFLGFHIMERDSMDFFANTVKQAVELRKQAGSNERKDFIQLMIEAAELGEEEDGDGDDSKEKSTTKKKEPLTIDELIGQSFSFFFAGFSTIAETLGMCFYSLATNPEVQSHLQEEIDRAVPAGEQVGYDVIFKMEYLDMVWSEVNRVLPVAFTLRRFCNKDFHHDGLSIPAGSTVSVNSWHIHHDPEHWPDPYKFDPERFTKEAKETRHPCAYMPFGQGPRNCVGQRFAILEGKLALIRILQKYSFVTTAETPDLSDMKQFGKMSLYPVNKGIHFDLVPRD